MTNVKKPDLPDPGKNRWWEITADKDGDYTLSLYKVYSDNPGYEFESDLVAQTFVFAHKATPGVFESEADAILRKVDVEQFTYVGTYFKDQGE